MDHDETMPLPRTAPDDPFEFGDQTICRMWRQPFEPASADIADEFGTMIVRPVQRAVEVPPADPVARLEQKVDALIQAVEALQKAVDSIEHFVALGK